MHSQSYRFVSGRGLVIIATVLTSIGAGFMAAPTATAAPITEIAIEPTAAVTLPPELDPFFTPPAGIVADAEPGQILRARTITPAALSVAPINVEAWQLLYRTQDTHGNAIATVTTVLRPRGDAPPGGRKLLSYQIQEDSTAQYCAPSYVIQHGSIPADFVNSGEALTAISAGVSQGWTVALPDYQGPNSAYGAPVIAGRATLDGIRAVESFEPAQLNGAQTPTALWGYSGGTIPTSWVAENAHLYAPELNIVGTASGGVALADGEETLRHNTGGVWAGLVSPTLIGIGREYPEVQRLLDARTDDFGRVVNTIKSALCHPQGTNVFPGYDYLATYIGGEDPLQIPEVKAVIGEVTLGHHDPTMPVFIYHAQYDEIIPSAGTDRLVDQYCRNDDVQVTYVRELLAEHISGFISSLPTAFTWIQQRLNGVPAPGGCDITSPTSTLTTDGALQTVGDVLGDIAGAAAGRSIGVGAGS
ncbi:lipase family protein [Rhodococcoides corynebacterioides]|uniref:lipase family protein n=1 Tax=Rhodococcoides corynebacterioides TaxID=53972 RepID=UPI0027DFA054|nr:lipase family protein [Rhodococcus corynebacterioides]